MNKSVCLYGQQKNTQQILDQVQMRKVANDLSQYQNLSAPGSQYFSSNSRTKNEGNASNQYELNGVEQPSYKANQYLMSVQDQKQEGNNSALVLQSPTKIISSKSKLLMSQEKLFQVTKYGANLLSNPQSQNYGTLQYTSSQQKIHINQSENDQSIRNRRKYKIFSNNGQQSQKNDQQIADQRKNQTKLSENNESTIKRRKHKIFQKIEHYVPSQSQKVLQWKHKIQQQIVDHQEQSKRVLQPKKEQIEQDKKGQDFDDDFLDLAYKRKKAKQPLHSIQKSASENIQVLKINPSHVPQKQKQKKTKKLPLLVNQKLLHPKKKIESSVILNPNSFVSQSIMTNYVFQTIVRRYRTGRNRFYPVYNLRPVDSQKKLMKAEKDISCGMGSHYSMYASPQFTQTPNYRRVDIVGSVGSNFTGSIFNIYEYLQVEGRRQIVATIHYESQTSLHFTPIKLTVYIKKKPYKYSDFQLPTGKQNAQIDLHQLYSRNLGNNNEKIYVVKNKIPTYNSTTKKYSLNFYNKAQLSSVKNIILEGQDGRQVLLFAKKDNDQFALDFGYPIEPKVAFGFTLSSFNFKLVCE